MELKQCSRCDEFKPLTEYYKRSDRPSGVYSRCKECVETVRRTPDPIPEPEVLPEGFKRCSSTCGKVKPHSAFYASSTSRDGYRGECTDCKKENRDIEGDKLRSSQYYRDNQEVISAQSKIYREENKEVIKVRKKKYYEENVKGTSKTMDAHRKYKYGLTPEDFQLMLQTQNGICALTHCSNPATHIDHNHETGQVRSVLCLTCNLLVGHTLENLSRIHGLISYLQNNLAWPIDRSRVIQPFNSSFYFPNEPWSGRGRTTSTEKACGTCRETKLIAEFKERSDGKLYAMCNDCQVEGNRRAHLARHYKMTLEEYNTILEDQGAACRACKSSSDSVLYVDHCHETETVRGLVCQPCNSSLGYVKDSVEMLKSLEDYLVFWEGV